MFKISIVIPTLNRPKDLADLMATILRQSLPPFEVIVVDDSSSNFTAQTIKSFFSKFESFGCPLRYVRGSSKGLTASRNLGAHLSEGNVVFFLDDDTLLDSNVICSLVTFFQENPRALCAQPNIVSPKKEMNSVLTKFDEALYKVLMLDYLETNKLTVRRSGASVFPSNLTKVVSVQRLSGCCFCCKHEVFSELGFDTNLKRWGFMEDLDFSFRVFKKYPGTLFAFPYAKVIHKTSKTGRLPVKQQIDTITVYWFYVFFKDIFQGSLRNLTAFLWALSGNFFSQTAGLIIKRKPKTEWWNLPYLICSYSCAFKHLGEIKQRNLDFFNRQLCK